MDVKQGKEEGSMSTENAFETLENAVQHISHWETLENALQAIDVLRNATQWQPMKTAPECPDQIFLAYRLVTGDWCQVRRDDWDREFVRNSVYGETEHFSEYAGWIPAPCVAS